MYLNIPQELLTKARSGAEFVPISPAIGGIKIRRKVVKYNDLVEYIRKLVYEAVKDLDLVEKEIPKGNTIDELVESLLTPHSGYLGKSYTNRDQLAYSISKLQEAIAILEYTHR